MAFKLFSSPYFILLLLILSWFSWSQAQFVPSSTPLGPDSACNTTLYPSFCKSALPNVPQSVNDYCRFSVSQSLLLARKFSGLVDKYLVDHSSLSASTIKALEDCKLLAGLNMDFLSSTSTMLTSTQSLSTSQTDYLQSLLSAIMTNQQTCLDGLQAEPSAGNARDWLSSPLSNGTKMYSVSLSLFNRGWVRNKKRGSLGFLGRKLLFSMSNMKVGRNGQFPLRMSDHNRKIFESASSRKLLQFSSESVLVQDIVVVNPDGSGNFTNINDAVSAAPNKTNIEDGYFLIYVVAGVYEEYVSIDKNKRNLMMVGDGINQTIITGNRSVADGWTTFNSATFAVVGQGFVAINITFRNTAGAIKHQAVAVRNGADLSAFYSCSFEGYQDTLYAHSLRQFYRECDIYGTVDFIFGNAAIVIQSSNLYARLPLQGQFNALTAQGRTDPSQNTGTSIHYCTIRAAPDLASNTGTTHTYLGRPWKQYSRTVYMQSFIDNLIDPSGWQVWDGNFALNTLYYAEYNNGGPGSSTANRVAWPGYHVISASDALSFTVSNFTLGNSWLPSTGVPYTAGLL